MMSAPVEQLSDLFRLELQLRLVGAALVAVGLGHVALPKALGWPADLAAASLMTRQVGYVHTLFVGLTCGFIGLLLLTSASDLIGSGLGHRIAGGCAVFFGVRWWCEFFVYDSALWRGDRWRTAGHVAFGLLWTWIVVVLTATALAGA